MDPLIATIKEVGFPIFISLVLLLRIEPTLRRLEITMNKILFYLNHSPKND